MIVVSRHVGFWLLVAAIVSMESVHLLLSALLWAHGGATANDMGPVYRQVTWRSAAQPLLLAVVGLVAAWLLQRWSGRSSAVPAASRARALVVVTAADAAR